MFMLSVSVPFLLLHSVLTGKSSNKCFVTTTLLSDVYNTIISAHFCPNIKGKVIPVTGHAGTRGVDLLCTNLCVTSEWGLPSKYSDNLISTAFAPRFVNVEPHG
jgi:hypothetical protein